MKAYASDLWFRALEALRVAKNYLSLSPDSTASRAYYAAFYAVSSHFALKDQTYRKHSAVESAVHRDLVKTGIWPKELGRYYSDLVELRTTGDYEGAEHVSHEEASEAIRIAEVIIKAIREASPELSE